METKQDAIDIASKFIGTNNRSVFNDWFYGAKGIVSAYCGTFVSYCYAMAGVPLPKIDYLNGFASVPNAVKFFREKNKLTTTPKRGDICFFDWSGKKINFEHTELFECDNGDGTTFTTVGGNTSNPDAPHNGTESNGGWVMRKTKRFYSQAIFAKYI